VIFFQFLQRADFLDYPMQEENAFPDKLKVAMKGKLVTYGLFTPLLCPCRYKCICSHCCCRNESFGEKASQGTFKTLILPGFCE
jgi:hypothetical protein